MRQKQPEAQSEPKWPEIAQLLIIHEVLLTTRTLCIGPVESAALFSSVTSRRLATLKGSGELLQLRQDPQTESLSLNQHRLQRKAPPHRPS